MFVYILLLIESDYVTRLSTSEPIKNVTNHMAVTRTTEITINGT